MVKKRKNRDEKRNPPRKQRSGRAPRPLGLPGLEARVPNYSMPNSGELLEFHLRPLLFSGIAASIPLVGEEVSLSPLA